MPNIINNLLSTETTANTNAVSSTSEQTVKDKPSLFDSLLSNNTATKEENITAKATAITTPVKEVKIEEKLTAENLEINPEIKVDNLLLKNIEMSKIIDEQNYEQSLISYKQAYQEWRCGLFARRKLA
mgnify:CR=1 FL=1